jgi:hypothetical protein
MKENFSRENLTRNRQYIAGVSFIILQESTSIFILRNFAHLFVVFVKSKLITRRASCKYFFYRKLDTKGTMWPAVVEMPVSDYGFGTFKFHTDHDIEDTNEGDVLIEVEPVRYELLVDKFAKKGKSSSERKVLASASIFRFAEGREELARMQKMLAYSYETSLYLGQMRGVIKGLSVRVHLPSGEKKSLAWGVADINRQSESMMVGYDMRPNSAVDVVISAAAVTEEQPYTATLVAVFGDESRRERRVEGVMVTHYLDSIRPEYSQLYVIKDQVMANPSRLGPSLPYNSDKVRMLYHMYKKNFFLLKIILDVLS